METETITSTVEPNPLMRCSTLLCGQRAGYRRVKFNYQGKRIGEVRACPGCYQRKMADPQVWTAIVEPKWQKR